MGSTQDSAHEKVKFNTLENEKVVEVVLDNPKTLNALDTDMISLLWDKLKIWNDHPDKAPSVVLMKGAGEKAF